MKFVAATLILLSFATSSPIAEAATLLQWKLREGQEFQVQVVQNSKTETTVNDRTVKMSLDMRMDMKWAVDSVDQMGVATISQKFTRMRIDMDTPSVGKVAFDTEGENRAGELTEGLADALGPLMNAEFSVQLTPRGEIVKVDIPQGTVAAIKKATAASSLRQLLSVEGLTQLLQQSLAKLPDEAIEPDHQWTVETTTASPLGLLKQTHKYTYRGTVQRMGAPVDKIEVVTDLLLEPSKEAAAKRLSVKSHQQSGSLFFDSDAGRFVATEIQQTLVSETPFRDLRILVSVETTSKTEITPTDK